MPAGRGFTQRFRRFLQRPGAIDLAPYRRLLGEIASREPALRAMPDGQLSGLDRRDPVQLCAVVREAARRGIGERLFDEQLLGALAMLDGHVVEMATGDGKTLAGVVAAAGFVARDRSVHVLTVNDYLADRDAQWMRPVYELLGIGVGCVQEPTPAPRRVLAYRRQVLYASASEIGFDVLRDSMVDDVADRVGTAPDVAIIDEADSVLVDEARVPMVLAGAVETTEEGQGPQIAAVVARLRPEVHYETGDDSRTVHLTAAGTRAVEQALGVDNLYAEDRLPTLAAVNVALYAQVLLSRDVDYIVRDGRVQLISDSRGRIAQRQRWPDGLQSAVEVKEALPASGGGEVLTSITMQALLHRYELLCGMTGTALAVAEALREFYALEIAVIPPHRPCVRVDEADRLYPTMQAKEDALVAEIGAAHASGQPVLVGTMDVAESQRLARRLRRKGLRFAVLNAKNDAAEARIITEAGSYGAITVSTQMAGRGTDIKLGGTAGDHDRIAGLGGLSILASGRYWTSRLDSQLRGRAGRQGDPGHSVIFTSGQDELIEKYGSVNGSVTVADIAHAQRVAEGVQLEIHRNTWRYNKLIEHQRQVVQAHRNDLLSRPDPDAALAERARQRHAELSGLLGTAELRRVCRHVNVYAVDRAWADHLAFLGDLREGIHLRALGRQDPLDEFHREAIRAFEPLLSTADAAAVEILRTAPTRGGALDVASAGVRRPSATWTYLVRDNPAGTELERAVQSVTSALRRRRAGDGA